MSKKPPIKPPSHSEEFSELADLQQQHIVLTKGTLVDSELCGNLIFAIYSVDLFLVEVVYDTEKEDFLSRRAFIPDMHNKAV